MRGSTRGSEAQLIERSRRLDVLRVVTGDITRELDLDRALTLVIHGAMKLVGATGGLVYLFPRRRRHCGRGAWANAPERAEDMSCAVGEGVVGVVAERREGMSVIDCRSSPLAVESFAEEMSVTALGDEPLTYRDRVLGVIVVTHLAPGREFTVADRETLALFAGPATIAISKARLYQEARSARDRLEELSHQLIEAQEIEHRRLAREFHDEIGQSLTAVKIGLQPAQRAADAGGHQTRFEDGVATVNDLIRQVRELTLDLRPSILDDLDLVPALRWYLDRHATRAGITATLVDRRVPGERLSQVIETTCFRVAQEALSNVVRHARARTFTVELAGSDHELLFVVSNDGTGFDAVAARRRAVSGSSLGLLGMEERVHLVGGVFDVESSLGRGTVLRARLPLAPDPASRDPAHRSSPP